MRFVNKQEQFKELTLEITRDILSFSETPGEVVPKILEKLLEITGAKVAVLYRCPEGSAYIKHTEHEIVGIVPKRKKGLLDYDFFEHLTTLVHIKREMIVVSEETHNELFDKLDRLEMGLSILLPLKIRNTIIGGFLILGLPTRHNLEYITQGIKMLGDMFALVFRFSQLYEDMEKLVTEKTADLKTSEERFCTYIHNAPDGVFVTDENGRYVEVNPSACRITGYSELELINLSIPELIQQEYREKAKEHFRELKEKGFASGEFGYVNKSGEKLFLEVNAVKLSEERFLGFAKDITERKIAEAEQEKLHAQLIQSQKMESVGRLAGGVAHDFNNMLSVILGYGETILEELVEGDPLRDSVKQIVEAGRRSAELTRQLLAFSRKQMLQPKVLNLNTVARNLEKMLRRLIGEDIKLELILTEELDCIKADPGQIDQVMMNLAINARDAMPTGGELLIETSNVELDESYTRDHEGVNPGEYVMLAVTDTGCGMKKEDMLRIFEPFFSTKEKGKGTGLGLSMVYGIVKQSGGNIWVYSELGRGTTFKIYLPKTEEKQESKRDVAGKDTNKGKGEHILVVEDEESLRELIKTILLRLGYKISLAENGGEALLLIEEKGLKPDLIITDVVMPNMSGKELAGRLKKNHPDLKVLFMSGYMENAIVHYGVVDSDIAFIQKPFKLREIATKVQAVLLEKNK